MLKSVEKYDPQVRAIIQLFILLLMGVIIGLILSYGSLAVLQRRIGSIDEYRATWNAFRTNFIIETIVISLNLTLLFGLFKTYLRDFKKTQSPFLFGLIIFLLVLFIQSLLNLPLLNILISVMTIGPQKGFIGILLSYQSSIFSIIANFFETIALIILFHLSNE
jgi:hypothetical protein